MTDRTRTKRQPSGTPLLPVIPGMRWTELRTAAVECARHGWPVLPGTYQLDENDGWWGRTSAVGLQPVAPLWSLAATTDPDTALEWWTRRPYSVLLSCEHSVSAVEVTAAHGKRALGRLRDNQVGPVAAAPFGCWMFFVRSDQQPLRTELTEHARAQQHARGCWLPLPPTARENAPYTWRVSPSSVEWTLPTSATVQQALVDALPR